MDIAQEKWKEIKMDEELDEETEESFKIHGSFIACILEQKDMVTILHEILIIILNSLNNYNEFNI